jgi:hypothetical protein
MVRVHCEVSPEQSPENGLLVSAYQDFETGTLVYVLTNLSEQAVAVSLGGSEQVGCYTTDQQSDMKHSVQMANKLAVPGRSVVTVLK